MEDLYLMMVKKIIIDEIINNEIVSLVDVINPLRIITVIEGRPNSDVGDSLAAAKVAYPGAWRV